jgi:hypothetical protein
VTIRLNSPTNANYSASDGNEVHRDLPAHAPPPPEGPHSGGDGVDMSPASHDDWQDVSNNPPPRASTNSPTHAPSGPFEVNVGVEVDATAILPQFPGMGGQAGIGVGVSSSTGPFIDGITPASNSGSIGAAGGVSANATVSFGYPTSQPATVIGGAYPGFSASVSYAPGDDGGFGTVSVQVGGGAKAGAYLTSTETTNLFGRGPERDVPEPPERDMRAGVQDSKDAGAPDDGGTKP